MGTRIHQSDIDMILEGGLHEFITEFIALNQQVAQAIEQDYRFYV
jgi:uncharacterized alpha-E superfamily protein